MEVWKKGNMSMGMKRRIYECVVVPKIMYGSEVWVLNADDRHRLEVFEMRSLRNMCGVTLRDRVRNVRIREWRGWDGGIISRYEQVILKWYGHVLKMDDERLAKRVFEDVVVENRGREDQRE